MESQNASALNNSRTSGDGAVDGFDVASCGIKRSHLPAGLATIAGNDVETMPSHTRSSTYSRRKYVSQSTALRRHHASLTKGKGSYPILNRRGQGKYRDFGPHRSNWCLAEKRKSRYNRQY
jgi:hypothetical protein